MMYQDRQNKGTAVRAEGSVLRRGRMVVMIVAAALLLTMAIGGTMAWLSDKTGGVENTFTPSKVTCKVTENFQNNVKTNVNVKNTGDTEAYIRVKLVTYRTNDAREHIGGTAELPTFTLGKNWVLYGGYYYYTLPVKSGESPAANLADSITLTGSYTDADGGHQSLDIMAEAIQSGPAEAVGESWGVAIAEGGVTAYLESNS
jgi:predicted ribosomally synthesized peptide with SipW-like signal peptide